MLKNYLKTAWRNLQKNRFYSAINISGLTVGLVVGILILLWVQDELSFDRFHAKEKNIYKLENMVGTGDNRQLWSNTAAPIGVLAKKEIPGIEDVARISFNGYYDLYKYQDKIFNEKNCFFTDPSLFSMFDFKLVKGNPSKPYPDNNSIVITETTAKKYFGNEEAMGKVIVANDSVNLKVTGIVKDFPKNSSFQADILFPMSLLAKNMYTGNKEGRNLENDFNQFSYNTFLLMKPGFSFNGFADKVRNIHLRMKPDDTDVGYVWLPLSKIHLFRSDGSEGGFSTVRMFIIIAILILVIACINYVNLSTARSMLRAKEVSLRKIVGAGRYQLFFQFIVETAMLFVFAGILAVGLMYVLMPLFNKISGKEIVFSLTNFQLWKVMLYAIAGTLVVSSIYPALLLSSFEPLKAMKGKISSRISDAVFRKVLVVVQFTFSIILITGTLIISNQLSYIRSKQLGYDKEHVIACNLNGMRNHYGAVKNELLKQPGIVSVTAASVDLIKYGGQTGDNSWDGKQEGETMMISPMAIDTNFVSVFKMQLAAGTMFTGAVSDSMHFILNETAVKNARLKDPVGKKFRLWKTEGTIIGVVKDFHFASMKQKIDPAIFYYKPGNYWMLYLKTTAKDAPFAIASLEKEWKKYNAGFTFSYSFMDESFDKLYRSEQRTGSLFNIFAVMAVFISCLGLLGLAAYTAQIRRREIGVRKVLGASIAGIIKLLGIDFIKLVLLAVLLATPIAWYLMSKWLEDFAYHTRISSWIFITAGMMALLIALLTISFQAVKAAIANPVKSLRTE